MSSARSDHDSRQHLPVDLANTIYLVRGQVHDDFATAESLANWLNDRRELLCLEPDSREPLDIDAAGLAAARRLRACVLSIVEALSAGQRPLLADIKLLNQHSSAAPHWNELRWEGRPRSCRRSTAAPLPTALGLIAEATVAMVTADPAPKIRACQAPGCVRHFVKDQSHRQWCSARCGNRARVARYYRRVKQDTGS